jgi:hypothetical protein
MVDPDARAAAVPPRWFATSDASTPLPATGRGREHWLSIRPEGFAAAEDWIGEQTAF